ncbi:unnamed protein product [Phytophthora fragariaefolia]|uniref:Unnamed protein product n=1 Tax=Phytophthora fragariaefolia TaxID=1490495 RepID=A0A9W7D0S5_9STRA|nr:unnamed protein product [Phytophthora fragariaefolia]
MHHLDRNFIIRKTRVTAALDGKNLPGFVTKTDHTRDSDVDLGQDQDLNPALSEDISETLDRIGVPNANSLPDSSPSESSDGSFKATAEGDGEVGIGQESPAVIESFTAQKQKELERAEKLKAKTQRLSSRELMLMKAKAKAFLIKTIDDQHVLLVKDKYTAFAIFQTICSKYEGSAVRGDPYYIQSDLINLSCEEGNDLTDFIYDLDSAMKAAADSTNNMFIDEQKTLYLYYPLPTTWKPELAVWKRSRKYIQNDLKCNIETKVQNELAHNRYVLKQGTPESRKTRAETTMQAVVPEKMYMAAPPKVETALVFPMKTAYCHRDNHDTIDCYSLQRHLHNGQIKGSTVIPTNF